MRRFGDVFDNYMSIVRVRKRLTAFTSAYDQISQYFPFIVGAPLYFIGKIQLGALVQVARAFGQVNSSLSFFVSSYVGLADFKAVLDRLTSFDDAIARAHAALDRAKGVVRSPLRQRRFRPQGPRPRPARRPRAGARSNSSPSPLASRP